MLATYMGRVQTYPLYHAVLYTILHDIAIPLSTALPAPKVSISAASGSPTAGQTYSLTCSVQVVAHLVVEPSIEWTRQDGTVVNASSGYSLQLNFNPLQISNSSHYTCRASVTIIGVGSVSGEASRDLLLTSELISQKMCLHIIVPNFIL